MRWLMPPSFEDEGRTHAARILYTQLGFAIGANLLLISRAWVQPELSVRTLSFGGLALALNIGLLVLVRMGRTRLAGHLAVALFWVFIQVAIITGGGLYALVLMGLLSLTIFAGLLFGTQGGLIVAGANIVAVTLHAVAESSGWYRAPKVSFPPSILVIDTAYQTLLVMMLLGVATRSVHNALNRANKELAERTLAEQALRESQRQLLDLSANVPGIVYQFSAKADGTMRLTYLSGRTREITGLDDSPEGFLERFTRQVVPEDRERFSESIRRAVAAASVWEFEGEFIKQPSERVSFASRSIPQRAGEDLVFNGVMLDITKRRQAERATQERERRLRQQSETLLSLMLEGGLFGADFKHTLEKLAECYSGLLGTERVSIWEYTEDYATMRCVELYESSSRRHSMGETIRAAEFPTYVRDHQQGKVIAAADVLTDPRTRQIPSEYFQAHDIRSLLDAPVWSGEHIRAVLSFEQTGTRREWTPDEEGLATLMATVAALCFEIHERRIAREALRESEANLSAAQSLAQVGSWELDLETSTGKWSKEMFNIFGLDPQLGVPHLVDFFDRIHPDDRAVMKDTPQRVVESGKRHRLECRTNPTHGPMRYITVVIDAVKEPSASVRRLIGAVQDITERKRAEQDLCASEERYRTLVNSIKDVLYSLSADGKVDFVSAQIQAYGYTPEELKAQDFASFIHCDDRARILRDYHRTLVTGEETQTTFRLPSKQGLVHWWEANSKAIRDQAGNIVAISGIMRDVTDRKMADDRIREQAALLEKTHDAILVWDLERGVQFMNPAAEELTARTFAEAQGSDLFQVLGARSELPLRGALNEATSSGSWSGELSVLTGDGRERDLESRWTLLVDGGGKPRSVLITCNDITEKKQLEAQYLRSQRLESVGTLASGVAHDLNNILSPIVMGAELLLSTTQDAETKSILDTIQESAKRGGDTVKQLLTFARGTGSQKGPVQPRHLLEEVSRLLQRTLPKSVRIYTEFKGRATTVLADPSQLHQVLMNLCVNARDAMPEGGVLFLTLETRLLDEAAAAAIHPKAQAATYVVFKVSDSGTGIPPKVLDRIFDPFFTTKPQGKGTGLGLSTVLGIVESHGGFVLVDSKLGEGTTFEVFLPACKTAETAGVTPELPPLRHGNGELVLIVDDEISVLRLVEGVLRRYGYSTLTAPSSSEALNLFEKNKDRIRATLTDIMMPFGDGRRLISMLAELAPTLPIIAMSGLATGEAQSESSKSGAMAFLRKPFTPEELLGVLHEALAR